MMPKNKKKDWSPFPNNAKNTPIRGVFCKGVIYPGALHRGLRKEIHVSCPVRYSDATRRYCCYVGISPGEEGGVGLHDLFVKYLFSGQLRGIFGVSSLPSVLTGNNLTPAEIRLLSPRSVWADSVVGRLREREEEGERERRLMAVP